MPDPVPDRPGSSSDKPKKPTPQKRNPNKIKGWDMFIQMLAVFTAWGPDAFQDECECATHGKKCPMPPKMGEPGSEPRTRGLRGNVTGAIVWNCTPKGLRD